MVVMTSTGNSAEKSCTMSKPSGSTADRYLWISALTIGCCDWIARGVNTLFSRLRMWRWLGGSITMIEPCSVTSPLRTMDRSTPRAEEKDSKSL